MPKLFPGLTFFQCPGAWFVVVVHLGGSDISPMGELMGKRMASSGGTQPSRTAAVQPSPQDPHTPAKLPHTQALSPAH